MRKTITGTLLGEMLPKCKKPDVWAPIMESLLDHYSFTTDDQVAAFIAQAAHESNSFNVTEENLYYSATGLNKTFAKYFKKAGRDAKEYAKKPEAIANVVYANRMGNGDTESGDGYRYRGQGIIQLTGYNNHAAFAKAIGEDVEASTAYIATPAGAMESALWFWKENNLNKYVSDFKRLTKAINGGYNGLTDRERHHAHIRAVMGLDAHQSAPPASGRALGIGDRGDDVKALQKALGIAPDGIFGGHTHRTLKAFQRVHGLVVDGVAGPKTQAQLYK